MQQKKSKSPPLTIVGIVWNVVGMLLVGLILYVEPRSTFPSLHDLTNKIKRMADTQVVTDQVLVAVLGQPEEYAPVGNYASWKDIVRNEMDVEYIVVRSDVIVEGKRLLRIEGNRKYKICIHSYRTHRSGLTYLYQNVLKAVRDRSFLSFEPYREAESIYLTLNLPPSADVVHENVVTEARAMNVPPK